MSGIVAALRPVIGALREFWARQGRAGKGALAVAGGVVLLSSLCCVCSLCGGSGRSRIAPTATRAPTMQAPATTLPTIVATTPKARSSATPSSIAAAEAATTATATPMAAITMTSSAAPTVMPTVPTNASCPYVASSESEVFHRADCANARRIKASNLVCFSTREEAVASGRRPAMCCNP